MPVVPSGRSGIVIAAAGQSLSPFVGPVMREEKVNSAVLPPTSPSDAYAADVLRLQRSEPFGPSDDAWLVLGLSLSRFETCSAAALRDEVPQAADTLAVSAVALGLSAESTVLRAARALQGLYRATPTPDIAYDPFTELVVATQAVVEEQELAGAFALAYATLHSLVRAFGDQMPPRSHGNVLAQMGRASRQLGVLDLAGNLYDEAIAVGYECEALDVVARGLLGHGTLAVMRGNYPAGRESFERALVNADLSGDTELIKNAHHGLQHIGMACGDLDAAMVHGWNVLRLCIAPDSRAEALLNMAVICRLTGEHDAALRTCSIAIEWSSQPRIKLHALCGALQSAVAAKRTPLAEQFAREIADSLPGAFDSYTVALIGIEYAEALHTMGRTAAAELQLARAMSIAGVNRFNELVHRAEQVETAWTSTPAPPAELPAVAVRRRPRHSEPFRMVLRSLNGLTTTSV
jgi:tetratricopeptide (TPR) repeat protein